MVDDTCEKSIDRIGAVLADTKLPMKERFRALFTLKNLGGDLAIKNIAKCFIDDSCLLKHELAYCLGQMRDERAIPYLIEVLKDDKQEPMVRHEAGIMIIFFVKYNKFHTLTNNCMKLAIL